MPAISRIATTDSFGEGGHVPRSFGWSETNATPCGGAGTPLEDWAATYSPLECDGRSFFTLQVPEFGSVLAFDSIGCGHLRALRRAEAILGGCGRCARCGCAWGGPRPWHAAQRG